MRSRIPLQPPACALTISSLGSADFRMDEWGVDVAIGGSQKGLMLPAGLALLAGNQQKLFRFQITAQSK